MVSSLWTNYELLYFPRYDDQCDLFWVTAFRLVRRIIGGVDYKGVREIMKARKNIFSALDIFYQHFLLQVCIDKVQTLPVTLDPATSPHLRAVIELLTHIFDRCVALLPGYFIVNEILKSYPGESMSWPHPSLVPLVASFLDSFRPAAQMVTTVGRHRMRPIVEMTGQSIHSFSQMKSQRLLNQVGLTWSRRGSSIPAP